MQALILTIFGLLLNIAYRCSGQELIANPDFEEPFDGDDWYCLGCTLTSDTSDAHQGTTSGRVTGRYRHVLPANECPRKQKDNDCSLSSKQCLLLVSNVTLLCR